MLMRYNSLFSIIPAATGIGSQVELTYNCVTLNCEFASAIVLIVATVVVLGLFFTSVCMHLKVSRIGLGVLGLLGYLENNHVHSNINDVIRYEQTHFADMEIAHII